MTDPESRSGGPGGEGEVGFAEQVRLALDKVLADAGLPWNQTGPDEAGYAVLYCGPVEPYLERFPHLAGAGWIGQVSCIDVIVHGGNDEIASVTVEGEPLGDLLRRAGSLAGAIEVEAALRDAAPSAALPSVRRAIQLLYGSTTDPGIRQR